MVRAPKVALHPSPKVVIRSPLILSLTPTLPLDVTQVTSGRLHLAKSLPFVITISPPFLLNFILPLRAILNARQEISPSQLIRVLQFEVEATCIGTTHLLTSANLLKGWAKVMASALVDLTSFLGTARADPPNST